MNLNIQIDRLILENISLLPHERQQLQRAIESELSRLLTEKGLPASLQQGGAIDRLPPVTVSSNQKPAQMAQQIAQDIYGGFSI
ncbi:MAG TPA: hypothetical protein V6C57_24290 [Coleofasciculaceae cyanobacterium]